MKYSEQNDHPAACVNVIIKNEKDEILLTRRNVEPSKGSWILPGGHIDVQDDSAESTAIREVKEETGLDCVLSHLVGVKTNMYEPRAFIFKVIFEAYVTGGSLTKNAEVDDFRWLSLPKVRKEKLGFDHEEILELYEKKKCKDDFLPIDRSRYTEWYGKTFPYAQTQYPRVACMGIILNDKKEILLGLKARRPFADHWNFPGGHMYVNETPEECLGRELREELGVGGKVGELFGVYSDKGQHPKHADIGVYYFVTVKENRFVKNIEMKDFAYFPLNRLPEKIAYQNRMVLTDIQKRLGLR